MISKNNLYLLFLSSELFGILLLLVNAKKILIILGLLPIALILISLPIILSTIYYEKIELSRVKILILLILPIIFINYIFFITQGTVVGYGDIHVNIDFYNTLFLKDNKINTSGQGDVSFVFIALPLIFYIISNLINVNIVLLASLIPPIFNLIITLLVYVIISRLCSQKLAILSAFLYSFQIDVLVFGREFRTQTIGVLFLFCIIAIYLISKDLKEKNHKYSFVIIPLLFSIVLSSFVSFMFSLIVLSGIIVVNTLFPIILKWKYKSNALNWQLLLIFILFYFIYLIHSGFDYAQIINSVFMLSKETAYETQNQMTWKTGRAILISFGPFISFMTGYIFSKLVIISSFIFCIYVVIKRDIIKTSFVAGFGLLSCLYPVTYLFTVLNAGRVYAVISILLIFSMVWVFFQLLELSKKGRFSNYVKCIIIFLSILYIVVQVGQLPSYIIGETFPIRSTESIDSVPTWNADLPQYAIGNFIMNNTGNQIISIFSTSENYYLLGIVHSKAALNRQNNVDMESIFVIQDKFLGNDYPDREQLPSVSNVDKNFNIIYSSNDYLILNRN